MPRSSGSRLLRPYAFLYIAALYFPILLIPLFSFNDSIYVALPFKGFTWSWYEQLFQTPALLSALSNSVAVGIAASVVATALGLFCALGVTIYDAPGRTFVTMTVAAPVAIPFIILGIFMLLFFNGLGMPLSLVTVSIAHVFLCIPFAFLTLAARLRGFDRNLFLAASDLGDNWWMTFFRVTLPICWPAIVSSLLLCFTISLDEFILAFFVSGTDATLPVYIWGELRFPDRLPVILALGSCMLTFTVLVILATEVLKARSATNPAQQDAQ